MTVKEYLNKRGLHHNLLISDFNRSVNYAGAVVIPAFAEAKNIIQTIDSLLLSPPEYFKKFLILIVINHMENSDNSDIADNAQTAAILKDVRDRKSIENLAWIEATLPIKDGGVGMARRIGLDAALSVLENCAGDPILISLDADTVVNENYLESIWKHFRKQNAPGGAVIDFCHQVPDEPLGRAAIERYELFLRAYRLGLEYAASPYAFHTVGSAMACSGSAYIKSGGMNLRKAGEDFYFLQQLHKTSGVARVKGTTVYPSPRRSGRVPFGTGRAVMQMDANGVESLLFHRFECFDILKKWLAAAEMNMDEDGSTLLSKANGISPELFLFLESISFVVVWDRLRANHRTEESMRKGFHDWFDSFRSMKLIHHLSDTLYPKCSPEEALAPLFTVAGVARSAISVSKALESMRCYDFMLETSSPG